MSPDRSSRSRPPPLPNPLPPEPPPAPLPSAGPVPVPPPDGAADGLTATIGATEGGACAGLGPGEPPNGARSALGADELFLARFGSGAGRRGGGGGTVNLSKCSTTSVGRDTETRSPTSRANPSAA